ncbi:MULTISPECIES: elongation factor P--(R)-beta-lysine ligase [unclassified Gilliamella]|uniref:elongation factor P--(R)-beta-lysine ligase n=1 Tax=unclassified Gilliamella TaxID=2685620 RepID=UPI00226A41C0|nr:MULTISPECIES: elongation factor P--(R)-beta-lysine ligase [unclassified Gilliamella]MCX8641625.1 elongation factor P--(R)-beta-lysine ligase [Gilliamella sp. B3835]MCX8706840.1 elongation factor P--(R)-beta-lysine ligase [Gilliamella sp. B3783]MCX8708698.1 elongation factor P--(R)-beta-lysine ligase [Gilliamella sp. B3780]MCX8711016.1 elongation factor P--(R)-beta-lysine ligase [Gilliamella sp. B3468]MCX8713770.1 elongation factor P--(R)-beta-lysine ligase [Gilliamella sp. B3781]
MTWQPSSSINNLLKRAKIISQVRQFFADRCILEVETPTLSQYAVTDVHLSSFSTTFFKPGEFDEQLGRKMSLITSPEYHMKRLLAAGSGPIFQICKCFRNHEEVGRFHNPEFTMLEWYRIQYDMMQMINEVDDLLQTILDCEPAERVSYQKAFQRHLNIDPLEADHATLVKAINQLDIGINVDDYDKDGLLQCLFTFGVEPHIGLEKPIAVYHFPASQAALAAISSEDHRVAGRFEFYYKGVELANGFKELTNSQEQRQRFEQNNLDRSKQNLPQQNIDIELLAAMESGLPDCAGVAIGLDRLIMLALNSTTLDDVISFTFDRA